ncbi:hypothetical protein LINPERPRIM_LOCUS17312 [Linum perenne]
MGRWVMRPLHYDRPDYDSDPTSKLFTIELHYGGVLIGNDYKYGLTSYFDLVEADTFSLHDLNKMTKFVGVYGGIFEYLWLVPGEDIPAALKPLHCDDDIRTLIEGLTPARTVRVYINKLSEFQARRRLAQVQLRLFEVVTRRRGVVIEEVMEAGGNGPGEGVVGSGNVSRARRLLRMSWAQLQIQSLKTNKAQWLRPPPIHRSPNSPTSPPPTHTPPPEIPVNPTSPPLTHTPPPERPVKPTSPPLTHSPPQENLDTPPLYEDDSSGYSYSSEDESFRADERELGDESSENEAFEYDEDEVDSEVDNVLRRRASSSSNQGRKRTPTTSDVESDCDRTYNEAELLNQTGWGSEEEDLVPRQFPVFQPDRDLHDPELKLGTVFESLAQFKQFCRANAVKQRRGIWFPTNDKKRCRCESQQLRVNKGKAAFWFPIYNGYGEFEVQGDRTFVVKLRQFECACGSWQLTVAATNGPSLRAPTVTAAVSGPKQKKRRASVGEFETTRKDKRGRSFKSIARSGQKQKCSVCKKEGHNKRVHTQSQGPTNSRAGTSSPTIGVHSTGSTFVVTPTVRMTRSKVAAKRLPNQ